MSKNALTKEFLTRLFPDNFRLAHHAIKLAQEQIAAGNEDLDVTALLEQIQKEEEERIGGSQGQSDLEPPQT